MRLGVYSIEIGEPEEDTIVEPLYDPVRPGRPMESPMEQPEVEPIRVPEREPVPA